MTCDHPLCIKLYSNAWRNDMQYPKYRGKNSLVVGDAALARCKHMPANWFLKTAGKKTTYFVQLVCFVSGQLPHGAFCERFNLEETGIVVVDLVVRPTLRPGTIFGSTAACGSGSTNHRT